MDSHRHSSFSSYSYLNLPYFPLPLERVLFLGTISSLSFFAYIMCQFSIGVSRISYYLFRFHGEWHMVNEVQDMISSLAVMNIARIETHGQECSHACHRWYWHYMRNTFPFLPCGSSHSQDRCDSPWISFGFQELDFFFSFNAFFPCSSLSLATSSSRSFLHLLAAA